MRVGRAWASLMRLGRPSGLINDLLQKKDDFLNWRNRSKPAAVILIGNGGLSREAKYVDSPRSARAAPFRIEFAPICTLNHGRFAVFTALFRCSELAYNPAFLIFCVSSSGLILDSYC